jgi:hypothetical protein
MALKHKINIKKKIVNFFGGLGYLLCAFEWLFTIVIYTNVIKTFLTSITPTVSKPVMTSSPAVFDIRSNLLVMIIAIIITIAAVILSVYVFIKTPSKIVKTSEEVVHRSAEAIAPVVLHVQHKPNTQRNHKKVVFNVALLIKILIVTVPIILCYISQYTDKQMLTFAMTMYACLFLAGLSAVTFALQYLLARLLAIKRQDIW